MKKRILILRDPKTKITPHTDYIEITNITNRYIVSYRHVSAIYLNKAIKLDMSACYTLYTHIPKLYITDQNGYILAKLAGVDDEKV